MAWVGRHRGLAAAAIVGLAVAASALWYVNQSVSKSLIGYWVIDDRTIGVQTIDGPNITCWVMQPVEAADSVRVDVQCHPGLPIGSSTAEGYPYDFAVVLHAPLGDRRVIDGRGDEAVRCEVARCGFG